LAGWCPSADRIALDTSVINGLQERVISRLHQWG
jgi:hypothetical protein